MIELYSFQQAIVDKALGQESFLNGSDLGTGKTAMMVGEIAQWIQAAFPVPDWAIPRILVIAPNSAKDGWVKHFQEMLPNMPLVELKRSNRQRSWEEYRKIGYGVLVVHWEAVSLRRKEHIKRDGTATKVLVPLMPELHEYRWDWVIADEAHFAKSRRALRSKGLKKLTTRFKRALTGTLIVNQPDDAWSVLNWLFPKIYTSYWKFFDEHVLFWEDHWGYKHVSGVRDAARFQKEIEPFFARVRKEDVLKDLPARYYTRRTVSLGPEQLRAYKEMKAEDLTWIGHDPDTAPLAAPTMLARLTRLRQFTTAYARIDEDDYVQLAEPSTKLDALMEIIEESGESKLVVWTQFRQLVDLAAARFEKAGIGYARFDGSLSDAERAKEKQRFIEQPEVKVFVGTMQSGGTGVDGLQHASSTVVFLDRSWSPTQNDQAESRLHRDGQKLPVQVILIDAKSTVDQVVEEKLTMKRAWLKQMLDEH